MIKGKKYNDKKACIIFSIIFTTVLLLHASYAMNIQVVKNTTSKINFGDILEVKININNLENLEIPVSVKEHITNADPIEPQNFSTGQCLYAFCVEPPYYLWNVTLQPLSVYRITYKVKPLSFGSFIISPTEVQISSGEKFYSDSLSVLVKCKTNEICEPNLGENYFTCPEDCPSGSADGVCDLIKDGRCDLDCSSGADQDCLAATTITTISTVTTTTIPIEKPSRPILIYIIIGIIAISILIFTISKIKGERIEENQHAPHQIYPR